MRKLFAFNMVSLDGFFEGPNQEIDWHNADNEEFNEFAIEQTSSVDTLVRQMRAENGTLGRILRDDSLYTNLVGITRGADSLVKQLTRGEGFAAKMLKDEVLYEQLTKTITDLNAILEDVRKNPTKYTKGIIKVF